MEELATHTSTMPSTKGNGHNSWRLQRRLAQALRTHDTAPCRGDLPGWLSCFLLWLSFQEWMIELLALSQANAIGRQAPRKSTFSDWSDLQKLCVIPQGLCAFGGKFIEF